MTIFTVEHDGFDQDQFELLLPDTPALEASRERLAHLLPHPDALLMDVFALLFKLTFKVRPEKEVEASVLLNRRIVRSLRDDPRLEALRTRSALDARRSMELLATLAGMIADGLSSRETVVASELVVGMDAKDDEARMTQLEAEKENLESLPWSEATKSQLKKGLDEDQRRLRQELKRKRGAQKKSADDLPVNFDHAMSGALEALDQGQTDVDEAMAAFGLGSGQDQRTDGVLRAELGRKLARSKKLRLLARLLGAFKEVANEARRNKIQRAPQTLHDVSQGRDLDRLLPSELLGLRRSSRLHRAFLRRYAESELLRYELRGPKQTGPMIICVDGSSSMAGSREIWSKAIALTFAEIARRQRRRCLGLIFSGGEQLWEVELSRPPRATGRARVSMDAVSGFAEHFPGGGTSFEEPLRRGLEALTEGPYRRGDLVFITDGEASVTRTLLDEVEAARRRRRFFVQGIALGEARPASLSFCDDIRTVHDLADDSLADLFAKVG
ncbi:MAG: VWA domain-containing protein [Myxococcota bacterium]